MSDSDLADILRNYYIGFICLAVGVLLALVLGWMVTRHNSSHRRGGPADDQQSGDDDADNSPLVRRKQPSNPGMLDLTDIVKQPPGYSTVTPTEI